MKIVGMEIWFALNRCLGDGFIQKKETHYGDQNWVERIWADWSVYDQVAGWE